MTETPTLQEKSQPLMNSINDMFSTQNIGEVETFNTSNFTIPIMRTLSELAPLSYNRMKLHDAGTHAGDCVFSTNQVSEPATALNQFILGQLNAKRSNGEIGSSGFTLPKLQLSGSSSLCDTRVSTVKFVIPLLKNDNPVHMLVHSTATTSNIANITKYMENLNGDGDDQCVSTIDLTAALSSGATSTPSKRVETSTQALAGTGFDIPSIECDRWQSPIETLQPKMDGTCQLQMPYYDAAAGTPIYKSCPIGDIWSCQAEVTRFLPDIEHDFEVKHLIKPFCFDIKSPDHIVLENLNKCKRQYNRS